MQISKTQQGGVAIYDYEDFNSGLIPQGLIETESAFTSNGFNVRSTGYPGAYALDRIDPNQYNGALSPGYAPSANATNNSSLAGRVPAFVLTDNSTGYGVDTGGRVQKITTSGSAPSVNVSGAYPHTITGTSPVGQDALLYTHYRSSVLQTSLFYTYYNNANWNVGILDSSLATPNDTFMSSDANAGFRLVISGGDGDDSSQRTKAHPMAIGADGILYIGSGRYVHAYDGTIATDGSFFSKVLTLPQGVEIVGMTNFNNTLLIATNYVPLASSVGSANTYVWDYLSLDISFAIDLEDVSVSSIFLWGGTPMITTYGENGRNGNYKLKAITGNNVKNVASWNSGAPSFRGVVTTENMLYMNCAGKIVTVGSIYKSGNMVNHIGSLPQTGTVTGGVLFYNPLAPTPGLTASVSNDTTYYFQHVGNSSLTPGQAFCAFPVCTPGIPAGKRGRIKNVEVEYTLPLAASGTNGTFNLSIKTDNTTTSVIVSANSSVALPLAKRYTRDNSGAALPAFNNFEVLLGWGASSGGQSPRITRVLVEWELLEITN